MKAETTQLICQQVLQSRLIAQAAVTASLGAAVIAMAGNWANRSRVAALVESVESLNREVGRFVEVGGCLDGIRGGEAVIEALKVGGANIESGLMAISQTERQAASSEARALWVPAKQRFVISEGGEPGAREFASISRGRPQMAARVNTKHTTRKLTA